MKIRRKKGYTRREKRLRLSALGGDFLELVSPFMQTYMHLHPKTLDFGKMMAREIASMIAQNPHDRFNLDGNLDVQQDQELSMLNV